MIRVLRVQLDRPLKTQLKTSARQLFKELLHTIKGAFKTQLTTLIIGVFKELFEGMIKAHKELLIERMIKVSKVEQAFAIKVYSRRESNMRLSEHPTLSVFIHLELSTMFQDRIRACSKNYQSRNELNWM